MTTKEKKVNIDSLFPAIAIFHAYYLRYEDAEIEIPSKLQDQWTEYGRLCMKRIVVLEA